MTVSFLLLVTQGRLLEDAATPVHLKRGVHGRKLLEEGMDPACLATKCPMHLAGCIHDSGCMKALLGIQACREDPLRTKLKSMCNPFPVSPLLPVVDACVNLAVYSFKDNQAFTDLTSCAQSNTCLTGVTQADMATCGTVPVQLNWNTAAFTPADLWETRFAAGLAHAGQNYTVVGGLNHGWDCTKQQHFQFSYSADSVPVLSAVHTVNLAANMGPLKFPYLMALGGAPVAKWDNMVFKTCPIPDNGQQPVCPQPGVWSETLATAGIRESDPVLVLDVDPPLDSSAAGAKDAYAAEHPNGADFALILMGVNVGSVPGIIIPNDADDMSKRVYYGGIPGGQILARDGLDLNRVQMGQKIKKLQATWRDKYGDLSFGSWCKLY